MCIWFIDYHFSRSGANYNFIDLNYRRCGFIGYRCSSYGPHFPVPDHISGSEIKRCKALIGLPAVAYLKINFYCPGICQSIKDRFAGITLQQGGLARITLTGDSGGYAVGGMSFRNTYFFELIVTVYLIKNLFPFRVSIIVTVYY